MDNNHILPKAGVFGGFKKKDVLSYIFELNETTQETQQRLAEQIEELMHSREEMHKESEEMQQQIVRLQTNLDDATVRADEEAKKNEYANELIEKLRVEIAKQEKIVQEKSTELSRQAALNAELVEKNRVFEDKRAQVELAASQIAGLLGQAKDDAGKVVSRAHDEAAGITRDAQVKADSLAKNAKAAVDAKIQEATNKIEDAYKKFGNFRTELETLQKNIKEASDCIGDKMAQISTVVSAVGEHVPQDINLAKLPTLAYKVEEDTPTATSSAIATSITTEASNFTKDILNRYGVRKDDSGFFRLAADK